MSERAARGTLEEQSEHAQAELARLLAVASERRAKMAPVEPPKRGRPAA